MTEQLCEYLEWDSKFFDRRVARVAARRLTNDSVREVLGWCKEHSIECLYFLADAADNTTADMAAENGFRFVDMRVTYERKLAATEDFGETIPEIRSAKAADIPALRSIASYQDSRFYFDPNFPKSSCDLLYQTWIEKSVRGAADQVSVTETAGEVSGFISLHADAGRGRIGLVGVRSEYQGHGLGRKLIRESLRWFAGKGLESVEVATQARNRGAQRLYQSTGFLIASIETWYHRWFTNEASQ